MSEDATSRLHLPLGFYPRRNPFTMPILTDKFFARDMVYFPVNITIYSGENFQQGMALRLLNETSVVQLKKYPDRGFESHPKTLPQQLHIALTALATV
jgi:hypothetical protein